MDEEFPLQGQAIWLECRANLWPKSFTLLGIIQAPMGAANWPTGRPMPPGIGTWSGGCQAQNSWHCGKHVSPFPLTPARSPKERENYRPRGDKSKQPDIAHDDRQSTLSWGRGLG